MSQILGRLTVHVHIVYFIPYVWTKKEKHTPFFQRDVSKARLNQSKCLTMVLSSSIFI